MSDIDHDQIEAKARTAIWSQDYRTLQELPQLAAGNWAGSVQKDLKRYGIDVHLGRLSIPSPAYLPACAIMLLKDEGDIIYLNLDWLYFNGMRKFALIDNGSMDDTAERINQFRNNHQDAEVIVINDPIIRYVQSLKTTALFRWAITMWPDVRWVFPIDADEFLVTTKGLSILDGIADHVDAVTIPKVLHFRHRLGGIAEDELNPLRKMDLRSKIFLVPPKAICRARLNFIITQGNHDIVQSDASSTVFFESGLNIGFYYREFQTRSFEHFKRKVVNGGKAILAAQSYVGGGVGGDHWLQWYKTLQDHGEAALEQVYQTECVRDLNPYFVLDGFDAST